MSSCDGVVCVLGCLSLFPGVKKSIVSEIAFLPPKPAGYSISESGRKVWLLGVSGDLECIDNLPHGISLKPVNLDTREDSTTSGLYLRHPNARWTILFAHGNSTDVGYMFPHLLNLCYRLAVNVFAVEYSGYGTTVSEVTPSETHIYADITAAYRHLIDNEGVPAKHIVLYGQSVGSAAVIDLASRKRVGGVIVHSGLKSGLSVIHQVKTVHWFDAFQNIKKIPNVEAPCFFIHGTNDEEVAFEHGLELYEAAPNTVDPWWVQEGGHNDIEYEFQSTYFLRLKLFLKILSEEANATYHPARHPVGGQYHPSGYSSQHMPPPHIQQSYLNQNPPHLAALVPCDQHIPPSSSVPVSPPIPMPFHPGVYQVEAVHPPPVNRSVACLPTLDSPHRDRPGTPRLRPCPSGFHSPCPVSAENKPSLIPCSTAASETDLDFVHSKISGGGKGRRRRGDGVPSEGRIPASAPIIGPQLVASRSKH